MQLLTSETGSLTGSNVGDESAGDYDLDIVTDGDSSASAKQAPSELPAQVIQHLPDPLQKLLPCSRKGTHGAVL